MKPWEKYASASVDSESIAAIPNGPWSKYRDATVEPITTQSQVDDVSRETEPSYIQRILGYWKKDIPEVVGDVVHRTGKRIKNVGKPTVLPGIAGLPERAGRVVGAVAGTAGEGIGAVQDLGSRALKNISGGKIDLGKIVSEIAKPVIESEPAQKAISWYENLPEAQRADLSAAIDAMDVIGYGVGKIAKGPVKAIGKAAEGVGKKFMGGELKIKDTLARRGYGSRIDIKKKNIIDNISKYNLESPTGNFSDMSTKASQMATERVRAADDILMNIATSQNAPAENFVDDILFDEYAAMAKKAAVGKEKQYESILNNILEGAYQRGMGGNTGIEQLIDFKRKLDADGNLFRLGPAMNDADNLERTIRKDLYRKAVDKIRSISPEAAELNKQAKELIDISNVAEDAASRISNRNNILSMSNLIVGGAGAGGALAAQAMNDPLLALKAILGTGATMGIIRAIGQGRGPAMVIKSGKGIQSIDELLPYLGATAGADVSKINYGGY